MPSESVLFRVPHAISLALIRFLRTAIVVGFAAFALALVLVRFVVFPQAESYRDTIAATLSRELGHPVEIAALTTGWDGWNPKLVIDGLRVLDPARAGPTPLLELPRAELIVAWTSLPFMDLRLKELVIERPRLAIRRDRSGLLRVAGIEIDPSQMSGDPSLTDWLLRQREIVIHDALITWDDDQRNAPQLVLDRVQFRLENHFGRHRFGLKGTPPTGLAAPLDLRGDLKFSSTKEWQTADGDVYARLDYADVAAWREWLPLPEQIASGKGALRLWITVDKGEPREMTVDLELADVKTSVAKDAPELDLAHLSGRVAWRRSAEQWEISTRGLSFTTIDGEYFEPTNLQLTMRQRIGDHPPSGQLEFDQVQLRPLVVVSAHLPLPQPILNDLARYAPHGTLKHGQLRWQGDVESPSMFAASADFADFGFVARDAIPGVTGLAGRVVASNNDGELKFTGSNATIDLPRVLFAPIALNTLQSAVKWERRDGRTVVRIEQFEFANADIAGGASGTYRTASKGPGEIDLVARASRADARQAYKYLPRGIDATTRRWLQKAIARGNATDARLKLTGNLSEFPFASGKGGQFIVTAKTSGAILDYVEGWPQIEGIDAEVRFEGARLTVDAARAHALGVDIGKTRAEIADLGAMPPVLTVDGTAAGPIVGFLRYVNESPLAARIGNVTRDIEASGAGRLALKLALPLGQPAETKVVADVAISDAQMQMAGVPPLGKINGKLSVTESDFRANDVAMEVLGGPAKLTIASGAGRTRLTGGGALNLASLRRELGNSYLDRVSGVIDWSMNANLASASSWIFESTMKGAVVDLPAPLGKSASETVPLRIERREETGSPGGDFIVASYGRVARLAAHRTAASAGANVDRALLSVGKAVERSDAARAERTGLWLRVELPMLDGDEWIVALKRGSSTVDAIRSGQNLSISGADLDLGEFDAFGSRFTDIKMSMRHVQNDWAIQLDGPGTAGTATWSMPGPAAANGRVVARLSKLTIPGRRSSPATPDAEAKDASAEQKPDSTPENPWPEIDLAAEALMSKDRNLGRLEFVAKPRGADWRIDKLVLASDTGRLEANGGWRAGWRHPQTRLDLKLDVKEAGGFLARFGYPDALQGAPTKIDGQLSWSGAPHEFDFATLAGTFHVETGSGRFTKIEPGPGKLLGVLSLQALPRRVSLDFRDIFSEGFAFDQISGNARIASGTMTTSNLKLVGPAAKVDIAGDANLATETQSLTVRVQPALSSSVSAGAALLFIANPIVGAVVGAGSFLAQTMLNNPIEQMFSYEYKVTGSWSDPIVTKGQVQKASTAQASDSAASTGGPR